MTAYVKDPETEGRVVWRCRRQLVEPLPEELW